MKLHVMTLTGRGLQPFIICPSLPLFHALTAWYRITPFITDWTVMCLLSVPCMTKLIIFITALPEFRLIPKAISTQ